MRGRPKLCTTALMRNMCGFELTVCLVIGSEYVNVCVCHMCVCVSVCLQQGGLRSLQIFVTVNVQQKHSSS